MNVLNIPSEETQERIALALEKLSPDGKIGNLEDLITEIKTNLVGAVNEVKTGVETHKAESASKHIKESGSNANGSYIKFDDGTALCFGTYQETISTVASGSIHSVSSANHTLPITLTDIKFIGVACRSSAFIGSGIRNRGATFFQMEYQFKISQVTQAYYYDWFAIGRWK